MVQVNFAERTLIFRIAYVGPDKSGKWTNLLQLQRSYPKRPTNCATPFFHVIEGRDLGRPAILNMKTRFQVMIRTRFEEGPSPANWHLLLNNVDGIIFMADAQRSQFENNLSAFYRLILLLQKEFQQDIQEMPFLWQWNKCDLSERMTSEQLHQQLNIFNAPHVESVAIEGKGVGTALNRMVNLIEKKRGSSYFSAQKTVLTQKPLMSREEELLQHQKLRRLGASEREIWKFLLGSTHLSYEMDQWYSVQKFQEETLGSFFCPSRFLSGEELEEVISEYQSHSEELERRKALWALTQMVRNEPQSEFQ